MEGLITIVSEKCNNCGLCVNVCLGGLKEGENGGLPAVAFPADCFLCGHCIAVCIKDAVSIRQMDMYNFPLAHDEMNLEPNKLADFLRIRRSVRLYKKRTVTKEIIEQLLEVARYAPTGSNAQSLRYIIVQDRQTLDELTRLCIEMYREDINASQDEGALASMDPKEAAKVKQDAIYYKDLVSGYDQGDDPLFYRAPGLVVIHAPTALTSCPEEDSTLAAYHMMLMAESLGLGTCFIGYFYPQATKSEDIRKVLGVPSEDEIYMAFIFSYPAVRFQRLVDRKTPQVRWI